MARRGRPTVEITLSAEERETLQRWARRHSSAQALATRCRIVLACAEGRSGGEVAAELRVHPATVSKWRRRFAKDRLDGLVDAPRPGAARTIGDDVIEAILVEPLETALPVLQLPGQPGQPPAVALIHVDRHRSPPFPVTSPAAALPPSSPACGRRPSASTERSPSPPCRRSASSSSAGPA